MSRGCDQEVSDTVARRTSTGDPRFVSAFAATENGFSGGDYSAPYSASAPRYSSSVWFHAFGGVADADANTYTIGVYTPATRAQASI